MDKEIIKLLGTSISLKTPKKPNKQSRKFFATDRCYGYPHNLDWDRQYRGYLFNDKIFINHSSELSPVYFEYDSNEIDKKYITEYEKPEIDLKTISSVLTVLYNKIEEIKDRLDNV